MNSFIRKVLHQFNFHLFLWNRSNIKRYNGIQWAPKEEIEKLRVDKLKYILYHAVNYVPYYSFLKNEIDFENFSIKELYKFPVIDKSTIRKNYKSFLSTKNKGIISKTSGTSGEPFKYYLPYTSWAIEKLTYSRAWGMGKHYVYQIGDPVVLLRSYTPGKGEPLWYHSKKDNFYYLSAFHINEENLSMYVSIIEMSKSRILRGYGSSIYIFTLLLRKKKIKLTYINTIITSSETLLPYQREIIEEFFGVSVLDWYGQNENTVTVQQCWAGNYHNNDDYGILEISNDNEIIATSLNNDVMPFIRYNTKDIAVRLDEDISTCPCGRNFSIPFKRVEGRADDILIKEDGTLIPTANFSTLMKSFDLVEQYQIIQRPNKDVVLKLVSNSVDTTYFNKIKEEYILRLGKISIDIELVDVIPRDARTGKIKVSIQEGKL